jgi:hypothetical protein
LAKLVVIVQASIAARVQVNGDRFDIGVGMECIQLLDETVSGGMQHRHAQECGSFRTHRARAAHLSTDQSSSKTVRTVMRL